MSGSGSAMLLLLLVLLTCNWWLSLVKGDCSTRLYDYKQDEPSIGMHVLCAYPSDKTPGIMVIKGLEHAYREFYMSHHGDSGHVQSLLKELYDILGSCLNLFQKVSHINQFYYIQKYQNIQTH